MYANEGRDRVSSKQSDMNRQELPILDSREQDAEEDNDDLDLSLPAAKLLVNLKKDYSGYKD